MLQLLLVCFLQSSCCFFIIIYVVVYIYLFCAFHCFTHHHLIHQGHLQALTDQLAEEGEGGGGEGLTQAQVVSARDPVGPVVV